MIHTLVRERDGRLDGYITRSADVVEWHVYVPAGDPAIALYEKLGMIVEHRSTIVRLPRGCELPSAAAIALPVSPDEDDDLERALGLVAGRIAMLRKRPGCRLVQLRDARCAPVGFAAYDPIGALATCRVARPEFAGALIAALDVPGELELDIEDDRALRELLVAAGGRVQLELIHYRSAI